MKTWRRRQHLERQQQLRHWLETMDWGDLYPRPDQCQIVQDAPRRSLIILSADQRPLVEITCFHDADQYRLEMLVGMIDLRDQALSGEDHLILTIYLVTRLNGAHPSGSVICRSRSGGIIDLCWTQALPGEYTRNQELFEHYLRDQVGGYLLREVLPEMEAGVQAYIQLLQELSRESEFHLDDEDEVETEE